MSTTNKNKTDAITDATSNTTNASNNAGDTADVNNVINNGLPPVTPVISNYDASDNNDAGDTKDDGRVIGYKYTANSDDTIEDGEVCCSGSAGSIDTDAAMKEPVAKLNPIYSNSIFTKRYVSTSDTKKNEQDMEDGQVDNVMKHEQQTCGDTMMPKNCKSDARKMNDDEIKPDTIKAPKEENDNSANATHTVPPNDLLSCKTDVVSKDAASELNKMPTTEIYDTYPQFSVNANYFPM